MYVNRNTASDGNGADVSTFSIEKMLITMINPMRCAFPIPVHSCKKGTNLNEKNDKLASDY